MKLIVGLGNPGKQYEHTRHNAGFLAVDDFLREGKAVWEKNFDALVFQQSFAHDTRVIWLKPQTFMNESGKAVRQAAEFYKIDVGQDLLVVHDDVDLPLGTVRLADNSSSAGHKGVQNIIDALGTQKFHRVRIGINRRKPGDPTPTDNYVLQNFTEEELTELEKSLIEVKEKIEQFLAQ